MDPVTSTEHMESRLFTTGLDDWHSPRFFGSYAFTVSQDKASYCLLLINNFAAGFARPDRSIDADGVGAAEKDK